MRSGVLPAMSLLLLALAASPLEAQFVFLQNDSFESGPVNCQIGFVDNDAVAAKFTAAPGQYPYTIDRVRVLGCGGGQDAYELRIFQDDGNTADPGPLLWQSSNAYFLDGNSVFNEILMSSEPVPPPPVTSGSLRVELTLISILQPIGFANDKNGITSHRNFLRSASNVWSFAEDQGVTGDWILRLGIIPPPDLIFKDGFETNDLSRWSSSVTDAGDLSVSGTAALASTLFGAQASVNDTNSLYVQDDTPSSESRYRARFYFDPNGFDPGEASGHLRARLLIAFGNPNLRVVTLVLRRQSGAYSVEGRVRLNDGSRADTGFFPITDGAHFFEYDWIRASAPGASDGSFTLRIDNAVVSTLTSLNNDASPVDFVRMGALSIKTGAAGTMFFDQFESRRQTVIGP